MMGPRFGVAIAMSAVAVNGPLLVLSLLRADGIPLSIEWHVALVTLRALGTVAVMTVGSAFIAHAAAVDPESRWGLVVLWLTLLAGTAYIVTPMVVDAVGRSLAHVIPSELGRWVWSAVSVLSVELAAAGCIWAARSAFKSGRRSAEPGSQSRRELEQIRAEAASLAQRLAELERARSEPEGELDVSLSRSGTEPSTTRREARFPCPAGCGKELLSSHAAAGHLRACKVRLDGQAVAEVLGGDHEN